MSTKRIVSPSTEDGKAILRALARDFCTLTPREIRGRWASPNDAEVLRDLGVDLPARLVNHNPIYFLAQQVWFDNVIDDPTFLYAPFHRDILCDEVLKFVLRGRQPDTAGMLVLFPRDSFKSTFQHGVVPMWFSMRQKHLYDEDVRILLQHHKEQQAAANLIRLRQKSVTSPYVKDVWPEFWAPKDYGTSTQFDWPAKVRGRFAEPSVFAVGLGGSMVGWHFDLKLDDDLVTDDHIHSRIIRQQALSKYGTNRFLLDTVRGLEIGSGTRYHVNDLWSHHIKAKKGSHPLYHVVCRPAKGPDGGLLMPHRLTEEFLQARREEEIAHSGNDILWWLQYMLEVKSELSVAADPAWIRQANIEHLPNDAWRVLLVDPAWKGTEQQGKGNNAAMAVMALERRGPHVLKYLLDISVSNAWTPKEGMDEIFRLMQKWQVRDVGIETFNDITFVTDCTNAAVSAGLDFNFIDFKSKRRGKATRISTFLRGVQAGHFFVNDQMDPVTHKALNEFMVEFEEYPQCLDDMDDAIDVVSYCCDPAIVEMWTPQIPNIRRRWWNRHQRKQQRPQYTRYCGV